MKIADFFAELRLETDRPSFEAGDRLLKRVKQAIAGLAAYSSVQWARGMINQTVELGGAIADLSQKVGVPAETLQQLGFAAAQSGGSMESLGNSLGKLAKLAADAGKGGKEASAAFRAVGVRVKEADGTLRPAEDLLADIADHISKLPDGTEKTAKAMALFGRSGKDLIPLLNEGSDGIAAMRQEFVELGGQIAGADADALESYGDQVDKLTVAFGGIRNAIVVGILPALRELVDGMVQWLKANRAIIKLRIDQALKVLIPLFRLIAKLGAIAFEVISSVIQLFVSWVKILQWFWENFKLVISGAIGMYAALKFAAIQAAVATAAAWALPLAAIAAIAILGEDIFSWANGGPSALKDIHQGLVRMFVEAIEFWVEAIEDFFLYFDKKIDAIAKKVRKVWDFVANPFGSTEKERTQNLAGVLLRSSGAKNQALGRQLMGESLAGDSAALADQTKFVTGLATRTPLANLPIPVPSKKALAATRVTNITAPLTINVQGGDPEEIKRQITATFENVLRTAAAATGD